MKERITITVPESLKDITTRELSQYMVSVNVKDEEKALESALQAFCGINADVKDRIPKKELSSLRNTLLSVLNEKPELTERFTHRGVEYGFVPNLDEITAGEYIDLDKYIGDWANMHKALAVCYRPITKSNKRFYEIEPYEGSDKYAKALQDAPASIAVGMLLFFYRLGNDLFRATTKSLDKKAMEAGLMPELNSLLDGVGILPSSTWRAETFFYLTALLSYQFINS